MKFEEILPFLRDGWKIRRNNPSWLNSMNYIFLGRDIYGAPKIRANYNEGAPEIYIICSSDIKADDWELIAVQKVKLRDLTKEQYKNFVDRKCGNQIVGIGCVDCPFYCISCLYGKDNKCWIDNKDLYSDKFLDQEIEIEVEKNDGKN